MKNFIFIGDYCEDKRVYGTCDRLNPEAPVPILSVRHQDKVEAGMCGNVCNNLNAIANAANEAGMLDTEHEAHLFLNKPETPELKVRYIDTASGYILLRTDIKASEQLTFDGWCVDRFNGVLNEDSVVIISDYDKGYLSKLQISYIAKRCYDMGVFCFLDTKKPIGQFCNEHLTFIKINDKEYSDSKKLEPATVSGMTNVIVTRGNEGSELVGTTLVSTEAIEVRDVCGAGDAFLAALAYFTVYTDLSIVEILTLCNRVSGEVCKSHKSAITELDAYRVFKDFVSSNSVS